MISSFYTQEHIKKLEKKLFELRHHNKKIVLVTGVFDLLHQEHKTFLQKAKQVGDFLVVGVESDVRVQKIKGSGRPVYREQERLQQLQQLAYVDEAFVLPESFSSPQDHEELISYIRPDILAVSSHTSHQDKKRVVLEKYGGVLQVVHEHNPEVSTTKILSSSVVQ